MLNFVVEEKMSKIEQEQLKNYFKEIDTNGDGLLSKEDIKIGLAQFNQKV